MLTAVKEAFDSLLPTALVSADSAFYYTKSFCALLSCMQPDQPVAAKDFLNLQTTVNAVLK